MKGVPNQILHLGKMNILIAATCHFQIIYFIVMNYYLHLPPIALKGKVKHIKWQINKQLLYKKNICILTSYGTIAQTHTKHTLTHTFLC